MSRCHRLNTGSTNLAKQVAESIKVNVVLAKAFVNLVRGDPESMTWCTLVRPVMR